jgi:chitin disaccharide deacetylase
VATDSADARRPAAEPAGSVRRIWLCADDYGISPAVNAAIRDLVLAGRINATSVMVVAPSFTRSEALSLTILNAGNRRVAIGLHVTLTGPFHPLTKGFAPLVEGAFPPLEEVMSAALRRRLDVRLIDAEVRAQLAAFAAAFGRPPDFIDGHRHVHLMPQVRDVVLAAAKELAPAAWVRQCVGSGSLLQRLSDPKGLLVDWLSRTFRRRARALGVATNPAFAGTYTYAADADFAALFPRFLEGMPEGGLIMCHPGTVDAELERVDPLTHLREQEYAYFKGEAFPRVLAEHGVALVPPDLASKAAQA